MGRFDTYGPDLTVGLLLELSENFYVLLFTPFFLLQLLEPSDFVDLRETFVCAS